MKFNCDGCGICCEHVVNHPDIQHVGGVCTLFNRDTRMCSDYENRPSICNVCASYQLYSDIHSEEEYLRLNYLACDLLKSKYMNN